MPYLQLGKTNINYLDYEDKFIVTMILETSSSYEYPILVRDTPTMDIYFGKSFKERSFLNDLISRGVTLYLYRPIQLLAPEKSYEEEIQDLLDQGVSEDLIPDNSEYLPGRFIIPKNSPSWTNRDTIRLINSKQHNGFKFDYCYPKYNKDYNYYTSDGKKYNLGLGGAESSISNYNLDHDYDTLAFRLDFTKVGLEDFAPLLENGKEICRYIVVPYLGNNYMLWFRGKSNIPPSIPNIKLSIPIDIYTSDGTMMKEKSDIIENIISILTEDYSGVEPYGLGYDIFDVGYYNETFTISKKRTNVYSSIDTIKVNLQTPEKNNHYYELPNFKMNSDFRKTNDILSEATESIKQLEFYSKTIGKCDEDIKITITKLVHEPYEYRIVISRFDYEEYYEVNLNDTYKYSIAPLAGTINSKSKLVSCKLFDRVTSLPEGTFYLRGSYTEEYTYENRRQALDIIKETDINDDILIIDDLELWKSSDTITGQDHKVFLEYSTYKDNQTYITNRSYRSVDPETGGYNVYHEHRYNLTDEDKWVEGLLTVRNNLFCNIDVILAVGDEFEIISDKNNRLVYFYNDMSYLGSYRPGCYVFLTGLLSDNYSVESDRILYNVPSENIIDELPTCKSNYMLYNNNYYYYPKYQNGGTSRITTVSRFIVSKVGREFKRNKWNIISMPVSQRNYEISRIIRDVISRYSIIKKLDIKSITQNGNYLDIKLDLYVNELITKNLMINITLNYTNS